MIAKQTWQTGAWFYFFTVVIASVLNWMHMRSGANFDSFAVFIDPLISTAVFIPALGWIDSRKRRKRS